MHNLDTEQILLEQSKDNHGQIRASACALLEFAKEWDIESVLKLTTPFFLTHVMYAIARAPSWGHMEESTARFFSLLYKEHSARPNPYDFTSPLLNLVAINLESELIASKSHSAKIISIMEECGLSQSEIMQVHLENMNGGTRLVPLIRSRDVTGHEGRLQQRKAAAFMQQLGTGTGTIQHAIGKLVSENKPSNPGEWTTTAIERFFLSLPDEVISSVLTFSNGHPHLLESLARHRTPAAQAWLAACAMSNPSAAQMCALIQGSEAFDCDAEAFVRNASLPSDISIVVRCLHLLRPAAHLPLRDEFYRKPEIAVDADVMNDLVILDSRLAIRLLREGLERKLYEDHPNTSPHCYRQTYAVAAKIWDENAKQLFVAVEKAENPFGIQAALEEAVEHAPADADGDFDNLLTLLCFSKWASVWVIPMLELVAKKRPGRMIDGWWQVLDLDSKECRLMAAPALAAGLGGKAIPGIQERLSHAKPGIRIGGVAVLSELGGGSSVKLLNESLGKEQNEKVRDAIYDALKRLGATPRPEPVDPEKVAQVLTKIEAGLAKKMAKAKLPPGDWWRVHNTTDLKSLDGSPISPKTTEYLVFEHSRLKTIETAPDTLQLVACLDKKTAADFALALLNAWLAEGQDAKHRWVLALAGTLGDSRIISTLLPWIPKWCEAARHKLAEYAAQGISLLGSNEALMVLDTLASRYRSKFRNVGAAAAAAFQSAAQARGISPDELGDLVVPSFDFNEDGQRRFEWDGGAALAELTMDLKLEWSDPDSEKSWKTLPASASDAVKAEVKELGKLLRETGKAQALRLEQALVKQRRWPVAAWQELYEKHPLLRAYATRLVWGIYDAAGTFQRAFRRYPNGILADAAGAMEELPEGEARIGLLHPLDLDDAALTAWQAHLARFKVQPPFPQLDRPVERLEPNLHNRRLLSLTEGREISYGTFRSRAEKRGWGRGSVVDAGGISSYYKLFPGAGVEVSLETGDMYVGMDPMETLTLGPARFCTAGSIQRGSYVYDEPTENDPRLLTFGEVPPVVYSETVSDLKAIIAQKESVE